MSYSSLVLDSILCRLPCFSQFRDVFPLRNLFKGGARDLPAAKEAELQRQRRSGKGGRNPEESSAEGAYG